MESEIKYCMCCGESKPYQEFYLTKNMPSIYCKKCYQTYSLKERKDMEYKNVFNVLRDMKVDV